MNLLIGITGSVAAIRLDQLVEKFKQNRNIEVKIVVTKSSKHFLQYFKHPHLDDDEEFKNWKSKQDKVVHIELRKWADIFLIVPLSANTLAKLACGMCDNLLTSVVRAWDVNKPIVAALAMNTLMYNNPFTQEHVEKLKSVYKMRFIDPVEKLLACGDVGVGALASDETIYEYIIVNYQ